MCPELHDDILGIIAEHCDLRTLMKSFSRIDRLCHSIGRHTLSKGAYQVDHAEEVTPCSEDKVEPIRLWRKPLGHVACTGHESQTVVLSNPQDRVVEIASNERTTELTNLRQGESTLFIPSGVACDGAALFVAEYSNHRVHKLRCDNGESLAMASSPNGLRLQCPQALALSSDSDDRLLFVADSQNRRVVALRADDLSFVRSYAIKSPIALAERNGVLAVLTPTRLCILRVADGEPMHTIEAVSGLAQSSATPSERPEVPVTVAITRGGFIVATDGKSDRLLVLSPRGELWRVLSAAPGDAIGAVSSTADGRHLLVTDPGQHCVRSLPVQELIGEPRAPVQPIFMARRESSLSFLERLVEAERSDEKTAAAAAQVKKVASPKQSRRMSAPAALMSAPAANRMSAQAPRRPPRTDALKSVLARAEAKPTLISEVASPPRPISRSVLPKSASPTGWMLYHLKRSPTIPRRAKIESTIS